MNREPQAARARTIPDPAASNIPRARQLGIIKRLGLRHCCDTGLPVTLSCTCRFDTPDGKGILDSAYGKPDARRQEDSAFRTACQAAAAFKDGEHRYVRGGAGNSRNRASRCADPCWQSFRHGAHFGRPARGFGGSDPPRAEPANLVTRLQNRAPRLSTLL